MKLTTLFNELHSVLNYSVDCASQHHYWPGCTEFWAFTYLASSFLVLIICAFIMYKIHKENSDLKNYLKHKKLREKTATQEPLHKHA